MSPEAFTITIAIRRSPATTVAGIATACDVVADGNPVLVTDSTNADIPALGLKEGESEELGEGLALGEIDADGEIDGEIDLDGEILALWEMEADGEIDALTLELGEIDREAEIEALGDTDELVDPAAYVV